MKQTITYLSLILISSVLLSACKKDKENEENPDLTVLRADSVFLGAIRTQDTVNILANDDIFDIKSFYVNSYTDNIDWAISRYKDSSVAIQTDSFFYGTQEINYTISDKNGSKKGNILIVRGTAAQRKAYTALTSIGKAIVKLYAVDGDTAGIYWKENNDYIYAPVTANQRNLVIMSIPEIDNNAPRISVSSFKSILENGTFRCKDSNTGKDVFFTIEDGFSAQAKTRDGNRIVTVTGLTVGYNNHVLNYIYDLPEH